MSQRSGGSKSASQQIREIFGHAGSSQTKKEDQVQRYDCAAPSAVPQGWNLDKAKDPSLQARRATEVGVPEDQGGPAVSSARRAAAACADKDPSSHVLSARRAAQHRESEDFNRMLSKDANKEMEMKEEEKMMI